MNGRQRVLLVVAAAVLALVIDHAVMPSAVGGGWVGYVPNTSITIEPVDRTRHFLLRLALLAAWTLGSLRLLRDREQR